MMCKLLQTFLVGFLALAFSAPLALADSVEDLSFHLETGYRRDELDWNIGGGIFNPEILSELEWEDLQIYQIETGGRLVVGNGAAPFALCLKGSVAYGWIVDGENRDSDFGFDADAVSRSFHAPTTTPTTGTFSMSRSAWDPDFGLGPTALRLHLCSGIPTTSRT